MQIEKTAYDFDDLLLVPRSSNINSRENVDTSVKLSDTLTLSLPVIGSPMKGIMSASLANELYKAGGIGILHRFYDSKGALYNDSDLLHEHKAKFGIAIGLDDIAELKFVASLEPDIICIDVANGYLQSVVDYVAVVKQYIVKKFIIGNFCPIVMVGNVVDMYGAKKLSNAGADLIRIGIGSGGLCTTRNVTGVGYPQLSAIRNSCGYFETSYGEKRIKDYKLYKVIADGGIRNSGDAVKALAAGADVVMLGSYLAKAEEAAHNGIIYGMASRKMQEEYYHGNVKSVEGLEKEIKERVPFAKLIEEFSWGIKSACTYMDAENLNELRENAEWVEVGKGSIKQL